jgi:hypothetical protein
MNELSNHSANDHGGEDVPSEVLFFLAHGYCNYTPILRQM